MKKKSSAPSLAVRPALIRTAIGIVIGVALLAFAGRFASVAVQPLVVTYNTGREVREIEGRIAQQRAANARLEADIAFLETDAGVEQEARRRGWVRPGEIALSIEVPEPPAAPRPTKKPLVAESRPSWSEWLRRGVDTCLAVFGTRREETAAAALTR